MALQFDIVDFKINKTEMYAAFRGECNYVWLHRDVDRDTEDCIYIERDAEDFGIHGGIERIGVNRSSIEITLNTIGQQRLGERLICLAFEANDQKYELICEILRLIFLYPIGIKEVAIPTSKIES